MDEQDLTPVQEDSLLPALDINKLNKDSLALINQIIAESDVEKVKDLTYLFNLNQNKKTIARLDNLSNLQDQLVAQFSQRMTARPDEISNQELLSAMKVVQDILERGQEMVIGAQEAPLIQINQQTNNMRVDNTDLSGLNRESRERVKNTVTQLLSGVLAAAAQQPVQDTETIIADDGTEGDNKDE